MSIEMSLMKTVLLILQRSLAQCLVCRHNNNYSTITSLTTTMGTEHQGGRVSNLQFSTSDSLFRVETAVCVACPLTDVQGH